MRGLGLTHKLGVAAALAALTIGAGVAVAQQPGVPGALRNASYTVEPFTPPSTITINGTGVRLRAEPFANQQTPVLSTGSTGLPLTVVGVARMPDWTWYQVILKSGQKAFIRSDLTSAPSRGGAQLAGAPVLPPVPQPTPIAPPTASAALPPAPTPPAYQPPVYQPPAYQPPPVPAAAPQPTYATPPSPVIAAPGATQPTVQPPAAQPTPVLPAPIQPAPTYSQPIVPVQPAPAPVRPAPTQPAGPDPFGNSAISLTPRPASPTDAGGLQSQPTQR